MQKNCSNFENRQFGPIIIYRISGKELHLTLQHVMSYLELGSRILASINVERDILSAYVAGGILVPPEFIGALTKIEIMGAKHKRLWPKLATMWSSYGCDELFLKKKKKESLQNVSPPWDMINSFRPGNFPQFFISHRVQRTRQRINRSS